MSARPLENLRILVVEDEYLIARDIVGTIEEAGGSALGPCPDAASARRLLERGEIPHGAVLDLNLNGNSVHDLARELARLGVNLLYHTGYDSNPKIEGLPSGRFVVKPARRETLETELALAFRGVAA